MSYSDGAEVEGVLVWGFGGGEREADDGVDLLGVGDDDEAVAFPGGDAAGGEPVAEFAVVFADANDVPGGCVADTEDAGLGGKGDSASPGPGRGFALTREGVDAPGASFRAAGDIHDRGVDR